MPDGLDLSADILPDPGLLAALDRASTSAERRPLIEQLRQRLENGREILRVRSDQQGRLYEEVVCGRQTLEAVIQRVEQIAEDWQGAANKHKSRKEALKQEIHSRPPLRNAEIISLIEEGFAIADELLALYPAFRVRLSKLAAERNEVEGRILLARPVAGEIDHQALNREFIARYPKIRSALAE
jgi:hypothetical protein